MRLVGTALVMVLTLGGCVAPDAAPEDTSSSTDTGDALTGPFTVRSSAFQPQRPIPREHTCDGANTSPPLRFDNPPRGTVSFALIMEDPDAPTMTIQHWRFWNLPTNQSELPAAARMGEYGAREGIQYRGPCPPAGEHRYFFYAYAVDRMLELAAGASVQDLRASLQGHTLAQDTMYGTYLRPNLPPIV